MAVSVTRSARASIFMQVQQVGPNVQVSWTGGSWDVASNYSAKEDVSGTPTFAEMYNPNSATEHYEFTGGNAQGDRYTYTGSSPTYISQFTMFDTGTSSGATTYYNLRLNSSTWTVTLPDGYTSGSATLSGEATFPGTTVSTLFKNQLTVGGSAVEVFRDVNNNTLSFQAVPEPSTYAMLLAGGLTAFGAAVRRRRRQAA